MAANAIKITRGADEHLWAQQDKDSTLAHVIDASDWLLPGDKLVAGITWFASAGISIQSSSFSDKTTTVVVSGGAVKTWYTLTVSLVTQQGQRDQKVIRLYIAEDRETISQLGSPLFPNRFSAVKTLREDKLLKATMSILPKFNFGEEDLWRSLLAAEVEVARNLRVRLAPTQVFTALPTQAEIDALAGKPYLVEPGYDYGPDFFQGERWGYIVTREKPIISVDKVVFAYPAPDKPVFEIPSDWVRVDRKYGHIQFVPASASFSAPLNAFVVQAFGGGRSVPFGIQVKYVCGLENAARDYPQLVDVVFKTAVVKIVEDALLQSSASISADGLSASRSIDTSKYSDAIDRILNGPPGTNGGLMSEIHGVRLCVA